MTLDEFIPIILHLYSLLFVRIENVLGIFSFKNESRYFVAICKENVPLFTDF